MSANPTLAVGQDRAVSNTVRLYIWAALVLLIAELIDSLTIPLGPGKVVLLPMIWALLLGAAVGQVGKRMPLGLGIDRGAQVRSAAILQYALLVFIAKLGLVVGG